VAHFRNALNIAVADIDARRVIYEKVRALGLALVNESKPHTALRARSHGTCLRYKPAVESIELARRGNAAALRELLAHAPDIYPCVGTPHWQTAAARGVRRTHASRRASARSGRRRE
jgi:hypothetical protein